jgi:hypothetical protein
MGLRAQFEALRAQVLVEEPTCRVCGAPTTDVDHVVAVAVRPDLVVVRSNLQGLCHAHHSAKTTREDGGFGRGRGGKISTGSRSLRSGTPQRERPQVFAQKKFEPRKSGGSDSGAGRDLIGSGHG